MNRMILILLLLASGTCASAHPGSMTQAYADPYEQANRKIFAFNKKLDHYALHPATKVYRAVLPKFARHGITNFLHNIEEPLSVLNAALQGNAKEAAHSTIRFAVNTVVGVGGLVDYASHHGRLEEKEDFGQTLAVWGVRSGPFLMLPLLGPSTIRDAAGRAIDIVSDPLSLARNAVVNWPITYSIGEFGLKALDIRSQLIDADADQFLADSLDEYATVRSVFLQHRQSQIYNGNPPPSEDSAQSEGPVTADDGQPALPPPFFTDEPTADLLDAPGETDTAL